MADQQILPFYGHSRGDYCEFSNFYWHDKPYSFVLPEYARQSWTPKEIQCQFSEKAIMAIKASLFDDRETFELIDKSWKPDESKALGRKVRNFKGDVWSKHLEQTAFEVVYQKFKSAQYLKHLLLKTGNKHIVEAAPTDCIWGVGIAKSDPKIWDPKQWRGTNVLGNALMQAREKLKEDQSPVKGVTGPKAEQEPAKTEPKRARWSKKGAAEPAIQEEAAPAVAPAAFDCYIVLDFEATCEENVQMKPQEIIEFPMVLVDAKSLKKVDEFRTYVRPVQHPELTEFCKNLTGIQQEQVTDAPMWPDARAMAEAWLQDRLQSLGYKRFAFVTCGDWDLKTMWLNVKKLFQQATGQRQGMMGMLERLDLPHEGRHHSGLDDCRNIARILVTLLQQGQVVQDEMLSGQNGYGQ